jgi:aromatic ring-opening dioxygenase LigB subunit
MPLIYSCIAPHAGDLIPETVEDKNKIALTRNTMLEMGRHLQALAPEIVIVINPHGFRVQSALSVCVAEKAVGDWSPDVRLEFDLEPNLANSIADKAAEMNVPVVKYIYGASGGESCFIPLDWGAVVPLYFLGHRFDPKPKLIHISPMRTLPLQWHYDFGRALGQIVNQSSQRIAIITSADQAHAHHAAGPYGFAPDAAQYDSMMQDVIRNQRLDDLLSMDAALVENAKPDSLWPTLILAGALRESPMWGNLLSYEINEYFGILCAEYQA